MHQEWHGRPKRHIAKKSVERKMVKAFSVLFAVLLVAGAGRLISYALEMIRSNQTSTNLKEVYVAVEETGGVGNVNKGGQQSLQNEEIHIQELEETENILHEDRTTPSVLSGETMYENFQQWLPILTYTDNPKMVIREKINALREKSTDIVGWMSIDNVLDEAVVQRDNTFFLNHDAMGNRNSNGSLFLDEGISLKNKPYTLLIYGHNMKSGSMFGCLRNYENIRYYQKNPIIVLESLYEKGRYVIFSIGKITINTSGEHYLDFFSINSRDPDQRRTMINTLTEASLHATPIEVLPEDQLLLLITCVDGDVDRRVVAARRIREGESELSIRQSIEKESYRKAE